MGVDVAGAVEMSVESAERPGVCVRPRLAGREARG